MFITITPLVDCVFDIFEAPHRLNVLFSPYFTTYVVCLNNPEQNESRALGGLIMENGPRPPPYFPPISDPMCGYEWFNN